MATEGVTSFSTGLRVSLGQAQANLKAQVTEQHVARLLEEAKSHPGFQAHADRYEFRLRTLNGEAVLELKEKNFASKLKSAFTGARKSDERKAAGEAIGQLFQIPKFFQDAQRVNSAQAQAFASTITTRVDQYLSDKAEGKISIAPRSEDDWVAGLQTTHEKVIGDVDEQSGLFTKTLNEVNRTRIQGASKGFELVMGTFENSNGSLQGVEAVKAGFSMIRDKAGFGDHHVGDRAFEQAKRNLMSTMRSGFQQEWLTSADARCREKYGMGALIDTSAPQSTSFHVDSKEGPNGPRAVVTLKTSGTLKVGGQPDGWSAELPPALALVDFKTQVTIDAAWSDLASETFDFSQAKVLDSQETFAPHVRQASPRNDDLFSA